MTSIGSSGRCGALARIDQPRDNESRERIPEKSLLEARLARLEVLATAVRRWLADPRYVTEQMMIKALRDLERD
jgi:hypothetical protein